ncbi:MAG: M1 family metallopeptidase, partial [Acidimicrobiia bacterium]|nr:M1 family metallopeptidase [Acidimicrobiia bacterium]
MVDQYRLPRTITPSRYAITLEPDLRAARFRGREVVQIDVGEAVDEIVLNSIELEIDEAWVETADGTRLDATVSYDEPTERATLALSGRLGAGQATLHTTFRGILNDKLHGFYRSTFTGQDGASHVIATTQFEATDARRAFPCWDEPEAKASFEITLVVDEGLTALSNAAEVSRTPTDDGRFEVRFAETMRMSTYLVAFIVGPLEVTDPVDVDGTPLRVAHPLGKSKLASFALESGAFALRFFQDYFGLPYPGDKLDLVAVPDFAFGAMENLGCVTFRETALLVDPERATQPEVLRVADVIHHEIAHMWFGDLVTMKWWNGIWLNEAFATFMEMKCTDAFRPEWERWTEFGISRSAAYDTDSLGSTRPVEFEVVSPAEAEGMFDILTYEKGAAVVRMLEQYLGEDRFRSGIRRYMADHQYGNTETTDLWDAIEAATGEPVRQIMDSWIFQGGHPVVSVSLADGGRTVRLRQEPQRYRTDGDEPELVDQRWSIPVLLRAGSDAGIEEHRLLLSDDEGTVGLDAPADWVVVNSGGHGFYRVRYAPELVTALAASRDVELDAVERYGLVDDAWASLLAGTIGTPEFLPLVRSFAEESDLSVWQRIIGCLGALDRIVPEADREGLRAFVRALLGPALLKLGDRSTGEPHRTSALRATLFEGLGTTGADEEVRARARTVLESGWETAPADPDLFDASVRVVAEAGGEAAFDEYLARADKAATPQDELRYLGALAAVPEPELVQRYLELMLTERVRSQDAPYLIRRVLAERDHARAAWDFIHREWTAMNKRYPSNSIARQLEGVRTISDPTLAADVDAFVAEHPVP